MTKGHNNPELQMSLFAARCRQSWLWQDATKFFSQNPYKMWTIVIVAAAATLGERARMTVAKGWRRRRPRLPATAIWNIHAHTRHSSLWQKATTILNYRWVYLRPDAAIVACDRMPQGLLVTNPGYSRDIWSSMPTTTAAAATYYHSYSRLLQIYILS